MSERYTRLFSLPAGEDQGEAPVAVAAGALLRDNETEGILAQLKLRNYCETPVKAVRVELFPIDGNGIPLEESAEHVYKDLNAQQNAYFGDREPISFESSDIAEFYVYVREVTFTDGTGWNEEEGFTGEAEDLLPPLDAEEEEGRPEDIPQKKGGAKNAVIIAICAVVVVVVVLLVCAVQFGWFSSDEEETAQSAAAEDSTDEDSTSAYSVETSVSGEMTMEDYSVIEVDQTIVDAIDDELVQSSIDTMLSAYETTETVTEGTVEEGDVIYISYVGTLGGVEFDGGTSEGTTITVGSSGYIDGFDDGLIGAEVGSTVDLELTFPEDYSSEDLAGQDVVFSVTIQYRTETVTPELDDEFVSENSEDYWGDQIDTVDELYDYVYEYLYDYYLHSAMLEALQEKQTIVSYSEDTYDLLYSYAYEELSYYSYYYGIDEDTFATYYGYEDADAYATDEAVYYAELLMLFDYLWDDLELGEYTDEDVDAALEEYIEANGYDAYYTLDEFKEASGEAWLLIYEGIEFRYDTVMEALEDRVQFV